MLCLTIAVGCLNSCGFYSMNFKKPLNACFSSSDSKLLYYATHLLPNHCRDKALKVKLVNLSQKAQVLTASSNNTVNQQQLSYHLQVEVSAYPYIESIKTKTLSLTKPFIHNANATLGSQSEKAIIDDEAYNRLLEQLYIYLYSIQNKYQ